jgi:hypothetical protein
MRKVSSLSAYLPLLFLIISICSVTFFTPGSASAQECRIRYSKVAPGSSADTLFNFEASVDGADPVEFTIVPDVLNVLPFNSTAVLTELETPGWTFEEVRCEQDFTGGVIFEITDSTVTAQCITSGFSEGFCTFFNRQTPANIPTLSEWGMTAAALGLGFVGVWFAVRRKRLQASA